MSKASNFSDGGPLSRLIYWRARFRPALTVPGALTLGGDSVSNAAVP